MKNMRHIMDIPLPTHKTNDCPPILAKYLSSAWQPRYLCMQDAIHMMVKAIRALFTRDLLFGTCYASRSVLEAFVKQVGKAVSGVTLKQLSVNYD